MKIGREEPNKADVSLISYRRLKKPETKDCQFGTALLLSDVSSTSSNATFIENQVNRIWEHEMYH